MKEDKLVLGAGKELRVIFDRRSDRWGHRIELLREGKLVATLSSIEGVASDDWPPSPAFQNLEIQTFPGKGQIALLVGKAGSSHWSAAIEADPTAGALRFDIACRLGSVPSRLGSTYSTIGVERDLPLSLPSMTLSDLADECRRTVEATGDCLAIRVIPMPARLPQTVRWQYFVSSPGDSDDWG